MDLGRQRLTPGPSPRGWAVFCSHSANQNHEAQSLITLMVLMGVLWQLVQFDREVVLPKDPQRRRRATHGSTGKPLGPHGSHRIHPPQVEDPDGQWGGGLQEGETLPTIDHEAHVCMKKRNPGHFLVQRWHVGGHRWPPGTGLMLGAWSEKRERGRQGRREGGVWLEQKRGEEREKTRKVEKDRRRRNVAACGSRRSLEGFPGRW